MDLFGNEPQVVYIKPKRAKKRVRRITKSNTIGGDIISQLLPFKSVMIRQLNKRGFNTSQLDFKTLVILYFNEFVSNKENPENHFQPVNVYQFRSNPIFRMRKGDNFTGDINSVRFAQSIDHVEGVTDNVISLFRKSRIKRDYAQEQGMNPKEVLTDEELVQAKAAARIENELRNKTLNSKSITTGQLVNLILIGLGIYIFFNLFK